MAKIELGEISRGVGNAIKDAASAFNTERKRVWFNATVFPKYTSHAVELVADDTPESIRKRAGLTKYSLPFQLDGRWCPSIKDEKVTRLYQEAFGSDLPRLYLLYDEGRKDLKGDEVVKLQPAGALTQYFTSGTDIYWWLYMPGTYDLGTLGTSLEGKTARKSQADLTAADVVTYFSNSLKTRSRGKVSVAEADLYTALDHLYETKPDLAERWQMLKERLRFTTFVTKYPEAVATIIHAMAPLQEDEFGHFVSSMREGEFKTWAEINAVLDDMSKKGKKLQVGSGSVVSALLYQGLLTGPNEKTMDTMQSFPPSVVLSFAGLTYINTVMHGYENVLRAKIAQIAELSVKEQVGSLEFVEEYKKRRIQAWQVANEALREGFQNMKPRIRAKVLSHMLALEQQMEDLIDHSAGRVSGQDATNHGLPSADPIPGLLYGNDNH